ncbi:hypothetical protein Tco_0363492 [Tanacetum coccineum]
MDIAFFLEILLSLGSLKCKELCQGHLLSHLVSQLMERVGHQRLWSVDLKCDNQAAIYIVANPMFHVRTKHIEVDCDYVRDQVKAGTVKPSYEPCKAQVAYVFTKVLKVDKHQKLLNKLGVSSSSHSPFKGEYRSAIGYIV